MSYLKVIKIHFILSIIFITYLAVYVGKYGTARQATNDNIIQCMRFAC
jgi:hypothetical protein